MRSLNKTQWERYFELMERLDQAPAEQRRNTLLAIHGEGEDCSVLSLLRLRLGLRPDPDRDRSGERIGNFVLKERIGCGGMGVVYRAAQAFADGIERDVAVKLIHPALVLNSPSEAEVKFRLEMENLVRLEHPNIARIYAGGISRDPETGEETPFMAMELVAGQSLDKYSQANSTRLGMAGLLELFMHLCDALEYAHRQGVIHRDLKPANILVDGQNEPRVIDFGLAQAHFAALSENLPGGGSGTPAYMSPEQVSGSLVPLTPASDIYALGVILYELLSGQRPYRVPSTGPPEVIAEAIACTSPKPLSRLLPGCSDALEKTLIKALAKQPAERYPSVAALKRGLRRSLKAEQARQQQTLHCRRALTEKVRTFWLQGVLENSLYDNVLIELDLEQQPDAVEQPWELIVQQADQIPEPLPPSAQIKKIFADLGQSMLILGGPGAGKTTLLLQLTRDLLLQAEQDERLPIPVVFHLATWAEARMPLHDWLADELDKRYDLPRDIAQAYLCDERMVLLLDGLDEVAAAHRVRCIESINAFRRWHALTPLVVCGRVADYKALSMRLRLTAAVLIQPLSRRQVDNYLNRAQTLAGLHNALRQDDKLLEFLTTPLMLSIAALAYQRRPAQAIHMITGTPEAQRAHLFARYTDAMFKRRCQPAYTPEQSTLWLAWLADALIRQNQSVFYLEWMQPEWLPAPRQQQLVSVGSVALCGLLSGLLLGLFGGLHTELAFSLPIALVLGAGGGLVYGVKGYGDKIRPITRLRWSWSALRLGLVGKLTAALGAGLSSCAVIALLIDWRVGTVVGGLFLLAFIAYGALDFGLINADARHRTAVNEGIRRSLRNAALGALAGAAAGGLCGALVGGPAGGLCAALLFGLILGLFVGGHTCLQHLILRLLLWLNGYAPMRYIRFLEHAVERIFLHRVGGGYVFIHRALLEYFAGLHRSTSR